MKKVTEEKILADARTNLFGLAIVLSLFAFQAFESGNLFDWIWFLCVTVLALATEGYRSIRFLVDKKYLKRDLIKTNDERNIQIDSLAYRQMVKIMAVSYCFLSGVALGYFSKDLTSEQFMVMLVAVIGFGFFNLLLFYLIKWHYGRQL